MLPYAISLCRHVGSILSAGCQLSFPMLSTRSWSDARLQPKAAAKIQNYEMRYSDAGALMTFLIGTDDAGCARRLRHQINVFAEGLDVGAGLIRDSSFHTQLLPLVIRRLAATRCPQY